jgi:L-alanine-DL-glutamate epimerase-like enolase superfamily enzyme
MTRRTLMQTAAGATMAQSNPNRIETEVVRLKLKHTWTTTMSSSEFRDNLYVRVTSGGITGVGEGAPIVRYKESAVEGQKIVDSLKPLLAKADFRQYRQIVSEVFAKVPGQYAAKAAVDIALVDWAAQRMGVPVWQMLGLDPAQSKITTYSIGIDTPEITKQKVREAAEYPVLKIKVGLDKDESTMEAVRSVTKKPLRLDANEGFKTKEEAVRKINWLESLGAEFIEQPLPAGMEEDTRWVRSRVHIPILADEACLHPEDVPKIADSYDGVVIKLDKTGGIVEALRMIDIARALKMKTMLGCMISSSVTITAAAHLTPLVDYADLDGNLLIANDPYSGVQVKNGKLVLPTRPGLGLAKR